MKVSVSFTYAYLANQLCFIDLIKNENNRNDVPKQKLRFPAHRSAGCVVDWVGDFCRWASSATKIATETKYDIKVA